MSAMITKSWPRNNREAVEGLDEILEHLLMGPDMKQLFKLYSVYTAGWGCCPSSGRTWQGTEEKLLANNTEDAKRLMAAASSVFMKVAGDILDGSILVRRLELILKHKSQFLDLWQLETESSSVMEETLNWRMDEVVFLKREKRQVDSLLRLCGKVKHLIQVDFGEIEARHSEDLNHKRLNEAMRVSQPASSACKQMTHYNMDCEVQEMAARIDSLMDSHIFQIFWEEAAESLSYPQGESERLMTSRPPSLRHWTRSAHSISGLRSCCRTSASPAASVWRNWPCRRPWEVWGGLDFSCLPSGVSELEVTVTHSCVCFKWGTVSASRPTVQSASGQLFRVLVKTVCFAALSICVRKHLDFLCSF
uniref:E3 ubiquitin-protein ligase RNF213-like isoform X1 n=1 Tax=Ictidomys tridecemlineatus TaxID=43179 RepID=UPI001A9CEC55|nr:E3 ubiquitin-protein ligase RNF213-like isoform X1 [Ictidomys tridecemlineatus]